MIHGIVQHAILHIHVSITTHIHSIIFSHGLLTVYMYAFGNGQIETLYKTKNNLPKQKVVQMCLHFEKQTD